jgi:dihydrofolate synthase/folylpolyglutamate synthase
MNYEQAVEWVHGLPRIASQPGVENTRRLLAAMGNPERALKFVHIVGTNGKGSTTTMLASVLCHAGYKTGATISPYVVDFRERFQINGVMITRDRLAEILTDVRDAAERLYQSGWTSLVAFDAITAAALLWFAQEGCDIVCMEAGLGGRLDATNAVENTLVTCILSIGLDHTELLGDTVAQIATEKCGVFKNQCTVVCYPEQPQAAMEEIVQRAYAAGCALVVPKPKDIVPMPKRALENCMRYKEFSLAVPFLGSHQRNNASVAVEAAMALREKGFIIAQADIEAGIAAARLPARIEVLSRNPLIILDGAHNADGALALAQTLRDEGVGKVSMVIGVLRDKEPAQILQALRAHMGAVYTVTPDSPRALPASELATLAASLCAQVCACESVPQAITAAQADPNGVLICGSLYLAAQARKFFVR